MLGLDTELKQTRFYQEIAEEERREGRQEESIALLTRLLRRKFGIKPELEIALKRLPGLELTMLENLAEEILDFKNVSDLQNWLDSQ
ncbi:DUF4351 domain-containing protein [Methylotuvimicrobium sp. KM1]|uniref:DUF4351 domain-containing protein n=1 Tax=Methylotuvimicrobium sp. KM1 TaxID=3377707 RepID=UPI00384C0E5E